MPHTLANVLQHATRLTKSGGLAEATASLRRLLGAPPLAFRPAAAPETSPSVRDLLGRLAQPARTPAVPDKARFLSATFTSHLGTLSYKLYVPAAYRGRPVPLIVMLHGCTQTPDDFAAGTRMNEMAGLHGCLVAYPAQTATANPQRCWNWFSQSHQQRDTGEPALIAGITRAIVDQYAIDPTRIYIAGLSAGGATAAILAETYPDLYAAAGVHSGLPCGAARDLPGAFAAMQRGGTPAARPTPQRQVPTIIFHGDRDSTVNPRNATALAAQAGQHTTLTEHTETGRVPGGHAYTRILHADPRGRTLIEHWQIHGAAHAWSGGHPSGTYTDPRGPDATSEMLRFFLENPQTA